MTKESEALLEITEPMNWPLAVTMALHELPEDAKEAIRRVTARQIQLARAVRAAVEGKKEFFTRARFVSAMHAAAFSEEKP